MKIKLETIKNSKKQDTIKATINNKRKRAWAAAPSGTSAGKHEANAFPKPPKQLIKNINKFLPKLEEQKTQKTFDETLIKIDGTKNFNNIGGSTSTALSMAYYNLKRARTTKKKRPHQLGKVIGGGLHGKKSIDIQEILTLPKTKNPLDSIKANQELHKITGQLLKKEIKNFKPRLDLEGGWQAPITNIHALDIVQWAVDTYRETHTEKVYIGLDIAATELWNGKTYKYKTKNLTPQEQHDTMVDWTREFDIKYIEDPFHEEAFKDHAKLTKSLGKKYMVCGDDLFTTNTNRLMKGIRTKACNSIIIKPNQIGTITQTHETVKLAKKNKYTPVISHRSGETLDTTIARLAIDWNIPIIKIGIKGPERVAKLRELKRN